MEKLIWILCKHLLLTKILLKYKTSNNSSIQMIINNLLLFTYANLMRFEQSPVVMKGLVIFLAFILFRRKNEWIYYIFSINKLKSKYF